MDERDRQFLALYQTYRHEDQRAYYEERRSEFEAAHEQAITLTGVLMMLAAVAATLAAADAGGLQAWWAVLAVSLPMVSTAVAAYDNLYAFEQQAKLYRDAGDSLLFVRADAPDLRPGLTAAGACRALNSYVNRVESVMRREQGQWGQLIGEVDSMQVERAQAAPRR